MKILIIPTTDWTKHPVPNRLNFIFDRIAENHDVFVCHFKLKRFKNLPPRSTKCILEDMGGFSINDPGMYYIVNAVSHVRKLKRILKKQKIEVIVSANILPSFIASFVNGKVPIVYDYLDHFEESAAIYYPDSIVGASAKKVVSSIVRKNLVKAENITTITNDFEDYLKSRGLSRISVIPNGVDTSVVKPISTKKAKKKLGLENNIVLGYVGSMEYWVDLETVISALPELSTKIPKIKLIIVGPSLFTDYTQKLKDLTEKLKVTDKVIFAGGVEHSKIYQYISAMDICLNPRKPLAMNNMTIGGKVFNYLACSKPVLSSNMKSLERLFTNEDGLFFYSTKNDLIDLIPKVLEFDHEKSHYREVAKQYDWKVIAEQYENLLKTIT